MNLAEKQKPIFAGALLFLISFAVYIPALRAGFVWDDDAFLWQNPLIHSADGLFKFWFTTSAPDYFPLTSSLLWFEWRLFGAEHPWGYHCVNVLLHATSALLLWRLLERLVVPGAWLAALIFAVHPVNVESVAWITQHKNTIPMVFALLSALLYFRAREIDSRTEIRSTFGGPQYAGAVLCFVLALLAKTSVVLLPVALLTLTWWRFGSLSRRDFLRSIPLFASAALLSAVTIWFQYNRAIGEAVVREDGLLSRLALSAWAVWFYLSKALLPLNLIFVYPKWEADPSNPVVYLPLVLLVALLFLLWRLRPRPWARAALTALVVYIAMLFPVLGFFNIFFMSFSLVADHWQYFAIPAVIASVAAGATRAATLRKKPAALTLLAALLVLLLGTLTWRQAESFHDTGTLWQTTINRNPDAWIAHYNLGVFLSENNRPEEAMAAHRKTLSLKPDYAPAHFNIGVLLDQDGRHDEAMAAYQQALKFKPAHVKAHSNYGINLVKSGEIEEGIRHYIEALKIDPDFAEARFNLGNALLRSGRSDEALAQYQTILKTQPDYAVAYVKIGDILAGGGNFDGAIAQYRLALEADPFLPEAHHNLGYILDQQGRHEEAIPHYRKALDSATDRGNAPLAERIRQQLERPSTGTPPR